MGYCYTENPFHSCEWEGCESKSDYSIYPSGQPSGMMQGAVKLCKRHKRTWVRRYNKAQADFYTAAQFGLIGGIVKTII